MANQVKQGWEGRAGQRRKSIAAMPASISACLFDLDGVLTKTAKVHAAAWKEMFDAFLRARAEALGENPRLFEIETDYAQYVDGRLRLDGVRAFLTSRGIELPEGQPDDRPEADTIHGLGTRKNTRVLEIIRERGVEVYPGSLRFLDAIADAGLRSAVVSASKNCREVLEAAGLEHRFEVRVDGEVAESRGLPGKSAPDTFLAAAAELGIEPGHCALFEDAVSGVQAGRAGRFGWVVGVDRVGRPAALREHGADIVVDDLEALLVEG